MSKPLKVLLVEDSENDAKLALRALRRGGFDPTSRRVQAAVELQAALAQERWDAVISDFNMPGFTGMNALRIFRSTGLDIPFILISGTIGEETAVEAMKAGASDYLMKNSLARLAPALERELKETQMRAAHRGAQRDLIESESRLRTIIETQPECVKVVSKEGVLLEMNAAGLAMLEADSLAAVQSRTLLDFIAPEHRAAFAALHNRVMRGESGIVEFEVIGLKGGRRWLETHAAPLGGANGEAATLLGITRDITGRKEAAARIAHLNRVYAMLSGINSLIVRVRDRDELFREACRIAVEEGGFRMSLVAIVDRNSLKIVPVASAGKDEDLLTDIKDVLSSSERVPNTMVARAIREKQAVVSNESQSDPGVVFGRIYAKSGVRSMAILPLIVSDEAVGVFALCASEIAFFHEEELKLLSDLAGDISFALDHMARQEKFEILSRTRAVSSGINSVLIRVRNREELFRQSCQVAVADGHIPCAWIGTLDPATLDVTPVAWAGESAEELTRAKSSARDDIQGGKGAVGQAIRERRTVFNNDITVRRFGGPREKEILRLGFRSQITLPLFEEQTVVGTLTMYAREPNFFDQGEVELLKELAGNISFALANISRQQKLEKLARIRAVSSEINAAIIRINDREALLRETRRVATEHGKFELVWIALLDHDEQEVHPVAWAGFSPESAHAVDWSSISAVGGALGRAIWTRKPEVRNDIDPAQPGGNLRREALQKGCLSTVCLPLVVDDNVVALIALFAPGAGFFDDEELALLNEVVADVSFALQAIKKREKLEYLSYYDVLTGLPNRILFVDRLSQQMHSRGGEQQMVALIVIDIERFRNINESFGHRGGDELLTAIAQRLSHAFHGKDYLARVSSNGFGAIVRGMKDAAGVAHLVEKEVFSCFSQPFVVSDRELRASVKVGIALFPVDGMNADILFGNAESALKRAKASGERYLFYRPEMNARVAETLLLENKLRQALDREQFVLHYQPKVDLATGTISGLEALIRWNDPETGLVPPMNFIPLLEETGLILEVGRWAMQEAVADYRKWHAQGVRPPRIAVNVSSIQLRQKDFVEVVRNVIGGAGATAHGLDLEITESLIMEDIDGNIEKLRAVRDMEVNIAIDDFGTGYSSLRYLAKLPVNALKIDRSFIITMTDSADSMTIVSTIISLARALNLKVIAEGVDAEEQRKLLKMLKCDEMQGYLFSRPVPKDEVPALLQADSTVLA